VCERDRVKVRKGVTENETKREKVSDRERERVRMCQKNIQKVGKIEKVCARLCKRGGERE
jgi:hypothetical protein